MKVKALYTAMAALSLGVASTASAAAPVVTPLTQKAVSQPASEVVSGENSAVGGSGFIVMLLAIAAIGLGIWAAADGGSDPIAPTSP